MGEILQKWNCSGNHFCHLSHGRWFPNIFILFENVWQLSPRAEVGESNGKSTSKFLLSHHSKCQTKNTGKLRKIRFQPGSIKISTFHLRIVCCTCHIYQFDMCGKNLPLYSFQFEFCDEKQRETLPTDPGFSIIDININITRQFFVSYYVQHFSLLVWRLFGEDCRKMFDFLCFGLSVSMDSLPAIAVTKTILK